MRLRFQVEGATAQELVDLADAKAAAFAGELDWSVDAIDVTSNVVDGAGNILRWCGDVEAWIEVAP